MKKNCLKILICLPILFIIVKLIGPKNFFAIKYHRLKDLFFLFALILICKVIVNSLLKLSLVNEGQLTKSFLFNFMVNLICTALADFFEPDVIIGFWHTLFIAFVLAEIEQLLTLDNIKQSRQHKKRSRKHHIK